MKDFGGFTLRCEEYLDKYNIGTDSESCFGREQGSEFL